jgi:hypothetical protein
VNLNHPLATPRALPGWHETRLAVRLWRDRSLLKNHRRKCAGTAATCGD